MNMEGLSFPQTTQRIVNMVNSYATIVMELGAQLPMIWHLEPWAFDVERYLDGVKEYIIECISWTTCTNSITGLTWYSLR